MPNLTNNAMTGALVLTRRFKEWCRADGRSTLLNEIETAMAEYRRATGRTLDGYRSMSSSDLIARLQKEEARIARIKAALAEKS